MNLKLNRAIRHILLAGAATAMTAGVIGLAQAAITPGVQVVPPGPGQVPDYFGVSSNYATSPTPNFAQVTIIDIGVGTGAVAAATTVDYLNPNYGITPAGMYTGNLMDVQLINGGTGYTTATVTVTVNGNNGTTTPTPVYLTPIIVNTVIAGFVEIPHATALTDDSGINYPAWIKDSTTGQWLLQTYAAKTGWKQVGIDGKGPYWDGLTKDASNNTVNANTFSQPLPGTGIRKFVNSISLPGTTNDLGQTLSVADHTTNVAYIPANPGDQTAVPPVPATLESSLFGNSDYYEIAEVAYTQQLHSDLPPTHLRGYIQLVPSTMPSAVDISTLPNIQTSATTGQYFVKPGTTNASFLGPVIIAQKNKAVRVKAVNLLPTGTAGALPFPVDHTYMGAGSQDASGLTTSELPDTRTAIHLHGGTTPWISDGTPRQWFKPAGEAGASRGVSATDVPDMWFDGSGNLINDANCQGKTTCAVAGATNNPGAGALTFYYTNEESARLMFYHDHAEGITRLNVYDGLAAGYILQDPTEQAMTHGTPTKTVGAQTYTEVLPEDVIPLVIQEKTFVPDNKNPVLTFYGPFRSQLNSQDPTWRWGTKGAGNPQGSWDGITGQYVVSGQLDPITNLTYGANGPGDLWVPHVYMTNQNPGDVSGANPQGRWDYGSWFWPPATVIDHPQVTNPYYDAACSSANITNPVGTCEFQYIPGFPNGGAMPATTKAVNCTVTQNGKGSSIKTCTPIGDVSTPALTAMNQPSGTPEAFNDTAVVNGTVYPYINVEPKKYRLRLLSAGNDRAWNLSLWVASNKNVDSTSEGNVGATSTAAAEASCTGSNTANALADCTEVRMVPWNANQNAKSNFPAWWFTTLKGGITFDGRPGGVPDPKTRGPAMVQIGTEGGFLAEPAVIKNQPVNFEFNVKNILVTNVKEHALLIGPAERADVVVDFSQFAGSTLIMYNDAPAALPAYDLRLDYFTGGFDNTDTGGTFSTVPGYGPNTRTVMQFRVAADCSDTNAYGHANDNCGATGINRAPSKTNLVDDIDATWLNNLTTEVRKAFKFSQEPIVVPQAAYNKVYGTGVADATGQNISAIGDTALSFTPFKSIDPASGDVTFESSPVTLGLEPKAIQELFTTDYGRMNATLGTEIPNTSATTQTTIPLGYVEPPTELVQMTKDDPNLVIGGNVGQLADGTQIWKITHNGVDTHPIHFHLFSVQLLNRVGWDGAIYNPEPNEIGWKEVLRMNPLSDVIVALRPKTLTLPFKLGNSHHIADTTQAVNSIVNQPNLDPTTGNASTVTNQIINYGWEYVWHCHILGHEENDFMRAIAVAQVPEDPSAPVVAAQANGDNLVSWTDNSVVSNWVTIRRSTDPAFPAASTSNFHVLNPVSTGGYNAYGECTQQAGCLRTYTDPNAGIPKGTSYYQVIANSTVGAGDSAVPGAPKLPATVASLTNNFLGYDNVTANSAAVTSAGVVKLVPVASISSAALTYSQALGTTSAAQTVTLTNTGTANLSVAGVVVGGANANQFAQNNTCSATTLAPNASCAINVTFSPTSGGTKAATITVTDNSNFVTGSTQVANLSGTVLVPVAAAAPNPLAYGNQALQSTSVAQTVTLSNTGAAPLTISSIAFGTASNGSTFARPTGAAGGTCSTATPVAAGSSCTINVTFRATTLNAKTGSLVITDNSNGVAGTTQTVVLSGTGINGSFANVTPAGPLAFTADVGANSANQTVTISNTGNNALTGSFAITGAGFVRNGGNCPANNSINVANGNSCTVTVRFSPAAAGTVAGALTFTYNSNGGVNVTQTVALSGTGVALAAVPAAPAAVGSITNTGLTLNWSATTGAATYTVQRATNANFTTGLTTVATGLTTVTTPVTGLTANTNYYFRVVAVNATGTATNGTASGIVVTLPGTPTGVTAANGATGAPITGGLRWTAPSGTGTLTYLVSWTGPASGSATTTSNTQLTFTTAGTYAMTVTAVNASGQGAASAPVNVTVR
jgi:FtsP/CotA-like multicopper oxidase with cupredoxin domain